MRAAGWLESAVVTAAVAAQVARERRRRWHPTGDAWGDEPGEGRSGVDDGTGEGA